MKLKPRISDIFTTSRIVLAFIFSALLCFYPNLFGVWGIPLIIIIFATDMFDGWFARKFDRPAQSGAFYDITADRVTEVILLVPFVFLNIVNPLLLLYYITKDFLVDHQRLLKFIKTGEVPFKQGNGKLFSLVKSRFLRALYGVLKLLMIILLYIRLINPELIPIDLVNLVVLITVAISIIRTVPAFLEQ